MELKTKFVWITVTIILIQSYMTAIQQIRFDPVHYNCVHMSKDAEAFFENLGLDTDIAVGITEIKHQSLRGITIREGKIVLLYQNSTREEGHAWVIINLGIFRVPFDPSLAVFIDPSRFHRFSKILVDPGFIKNGKQRQTIFKEINGTYFILKGGDAS